MISNFYKSALIISSGFRFWLIIVFIFLYQLRFDIVTLIFKIYFSTFFSVDISIESLNCYPKF